jgi:hypothetical protein
MGHEMTDADANVGRNVSPTVDTAAYLIDIVDWGSYRVLEGPAESLRPALLDLLAASRPEQLASVHWRIENHVVVQDDIYSAAEPVTSVLVAALANPRPTWMRVEILQLLFSILSGTGFDEHNGASLWSKCRDRAMEGYWLLVSEALTGERDAALEVLSLIDDPDRLAAVRRWAATQDTPE